MLISKNLHKKGNEVSIKTRSTPASLSFTGQVTKDTTVKWTIVAFICRVSMIFFSPTSFHYYQSQCDKVSIAWVPVSPVVSVFNPCGKLPLNYGSFLPFEDNTVNANSLLSELSIIY